MARDEPAPHAPRRALPESFAGRRRRDLADLAHRRRRRQRGLRPLAARRHQGDGLERLDCQRRPQCRAAVSHARVLRADGQRARLLPRRHRGRAGRDRQRRPAAAAEGARNRQAPVHRCDLFRRAGARRLVRASPGQAARRPARGAASDHPGRRDAGIATRLHAHLAVAVDRTRPAAGRRRRDLAGADDRAGRCGRWRACAARCRRAHRTT